MRMELRSGDATYESWRYLESGIMVVKSIFSGKGRCQPFAYTQVMKLHLILMSAESRASTHASTRAGQVL